MKILLKSMFAALLALALTGPAAFAQDRPAFRQPELDQMLAPIALYPDSLLSQILMAATYPLQIVEADRWSKRNPGLTGDAAVRAVEQFDWDPSVKSLVAFPQILDRMDEKLDWTQRLGDAFLAQEGQVMDTVQELRRRAYVAGNLRSTDQLRVTPDGQIIVVEPANPAVVYVPYYDPTIVYGAWWWPAYRPVYWARWPGYRVGHVRGFAWGPAIPVSIGFFFGGYDWHAHHVTVVNNVYYRNVLVRPRRNIVVRNGAVTRWRHDPVYREGVPYRTETLRRQFERTAPVPRARRDYRGYERAPKPAASPQARTSPAGAPRARPFATSAPRRPVSRKHASAFENVGQGREARNFGARWHASSARAAPPAARAPAARAPTGPSEPRAPGRATAPQAPDGARSGGRVRWRISESKTRF
ncbi:MAG: DUF3300 domain-containing protein [Gammaproteobacteria bacterium]|nr:DUF3300 domain-containing protein [Gammaproteobacteria bacterium]MDH3411863.1 DUF3300 domain-containing protein [Gammaproteobacteria bacterium]